MLRTAALETAPNAGNLSRAPGDANVRGGRRRSSLRTRIVLTIALLASLICGIGALGVAGAYRANEANRDTYENKLTAAVQIGAAELLIARTRMVLGGAAAAVEDAQAKAQIARAEDFFRESDDAWRRFLAAPHELDETAPIERAVAQRDAMRQAMNAFIAALKSGDRAAATQIGTSQLSARFNAMSAANDQVRRALYASAKRRYDEANRYFRLFVGASAAATIIGLAVAIISGLTLTGAIMRPLGAALSRFDEIANGDLSRRVVIDRDDEMGRLLTGLARMQTQLAQTVTSVRASAESIAGATREIATGTFDLSARTQEQAASLEETAASVTQLTAAMKGSAEHASEARSLADELATTAASASQAIGRTAGAMQVIDSGSRKIADITAIIEGIAFQTNILALNAAVEAARAGPQGRGFAVVAGEVRSLAQHATDAAKEIGVLIADSVAATADGAALVAEVEHAVSETLAASERLAAMMNAVAAGVGEQRVGIEQIDAALQVMDSITQQNAALVEQASAAAQALDTQSKHLTEQVAFFRLA